MWNEEALPLYMSFHPLPFMLYLSSVGHVHSLKSHQAMLYFVFNHQTYFKELNRKVNRRKIVYNTYPNSCHFCYSSLLLFQVSFCCYSPSAEEFFSNLLVQVSWQQILLAFLPLKTSLFYLHS